MKIKHIKLSPVFGFGYWYEDYSKIFPKGGYAHNFLVPFFRIQVGEIFL